MARVSCGWQLNRMSVSKEAPVTQVELSNPKCAFPDHSCSVSCLWLHQIVFEPSKKAVSKFSSSPTPFTQICVSSCVTYRSWELMQLHLIRPQQELLALQAPLLPQFTKRPCTQGFHITELMIKGMPLLLPCPSFQHHFQVTALSHRAPQLLLQTPRKLSRNFYPSLVMAGKHTLV